MSQKSFFKIHFLKIKIIFQSKRLILWFLCISKKRQSSMESVEVKRIHGKELGSFTSVAQGYGSLLLKLVSTENFDFDLCKHENNGFLHWYRAFLFSLVSLSL